MWFSGSLIPPRETQERVGGPKEHLRDVEGLKESCHSEARVGDLSFPNRSEFLSVRVTECKGPVEVSSVRVLRKKDLPRFKNVSFTSFVFFGSPELCLYFTYTPSTRHGPSGDLHHPSRLGRTSTLSPDAPDPVRRSQPRGSETQYGPRGHFRPRLPDRIPSPVAERTHGGTYTGTM